MHRLLQPWGPLMRDLVSWTQHVGLQMTSDPRPPRADPLYPQASFSQAVVLRGGGWQIWAIDLHLFPAQMIQAGCCWGWG